MSPDLPPTLPLVLTLVLLLISVFVCFYRFEGSQFEIALKLINYQKHQDTSAVICPPKHTQTPSLADFFPTMPVVSTTSRANGAATGAHNPASPGLRPGANLQAVLAARASTTPAGGQGAAAAVTPSPAATSDASDGTTAGGPAPAEGAAAAAVLDGAAMQMADLVTAVTAANQAVLAPAADLHEHLVDGSQKVIVVVAEGSTSPEVLMLHSISDASQAGDIVAMV